MTTKCPNCQSKIIYGATTCKNCKSELAYCNFCKEVKDPYEKICSECEKEISVEEHVQIKSGTGFLDLNIKKHDKYSIKTYLLALLVIPSMVACGFFNVWLIIEFSDFLYEFDKTERNIYIGSLLSFYFVYPLAMSFFYIVLHAFAQKINVFLFIVLSTIASSSVVYFYAWIDDFSYMNIDRILLAVFPYIIFLALNNKKADLFSVFIVYSLYAIFLLFLDFKNFEFFTNADLIVIYMSILAPSYIFFVVLYFSVFNHVKINPEIEKPKLIMLVSKFLTKNSSVGNENKFDIR